MMYAAMLAGIAFNAAGCHLPHGLSYAVSGSTQGLARATAIRKARRSCRTAWRSCSTIRRCGASRRRAVPERHLHGAQCLGAETRGATDADAGDVLAGRVIELMRATAMPNGLTALGFDASHLDALATGAEPQYRVIRNAPKDVGRDDLKSLFRAALSYW